jgi:hypothetical protein
MSMPSRSFSVLGLLQDGYNSFLQKLSLLHPTLLFLWSRLAYPPA